MIKKNIDLIIIADKSCTTSLFYLEYLHRHGYQPRKIYACDFLYKPSFKSRKERLLYLFSQKIYKQLAARREKIQTKFQLELYDELQSNFEFKINLNLNAVNFERYSDLVEHIIAWDYQEPDFQKIILKDKSSHYLYTNGGIVPQRLFEQGIKFLHIHPGIVPYVKGSDGLLWSLMERGKLGYSCFYMNAGIDTGDLIHQEEFENIKFPSIRPLYKNYSQDIYKALLSAYDPHYRAKLLINVIKSVDGDLSLLKAQKQQNKGSREFYAMHPLLVKKCLLKFF